MSQKIPITAYERVTIQQKMNPFLIYKKGNKFPKSDGHRVEIVFATYRILFMLITLIALLGYFSYKVERKEEIGLFGSMITISILLILFLIMGSAVLLFLPR